MASSFNYSDAFIAAIVSPAIFCAPAVESSINIVQKSFAAVQAIDVVLPSSRFVVQLLQSISSITVRLASSVLIVVFLACLAYSTWTLALHPFAKYPGPFVARFWNIYLAYQSLRGEVHVEAWRLHETHGPFVRFGANTLLCNSAQALDVIYHSKQCIKPSGYAIMNLKAPSTFSEQNPKAHASRRRILSAGFSDAAMRGYEPRVLDNVRRFISYVLGKSTGPESWTEPQDFGKLVENLSFDIMTSVVYGTSYNLIEDSSHRDIIAAMEKLNVRIGVLIVLPILAWLRLDRLFFRRSIKNKNVFVKFALGVLAERKRVLDREDDVFSVLMKAHDSETGSTLSSRLLASESSNLIMAGSDTVATAYAATGFYLARYLDAYDTAAKEVRSIFSSLSEIRSGAELSKCQYLRACIMEAMRMSPSVGSTMWRQVLAGGLIVDNQYMPEGTIIGTSIYAIHHHKEYFPDPFKFIPERWLSDSPLYASKEARLAYNPFSLGTRSCIGKSLALNELMLTFAALFVATDFRLPICQDARKGEGVASAEHGRHRVFEYQSPHYLVACRNGPMMEFRPRLSAASTGS